MIMAATTTPTAEGAAPKPLTPKQARVRLAEVKTEIEKVREQIQNIE